MVSGVHRHAGEVAVAGIGWTEVARRSDHSENELAVGAALGAIADAGLTPEDIDGLAVYPDRLASAVPSGFEGPSITYLHRALGLGELNWWQAFGWGPAQMAPVFGAIHAIISGTASRVLVVRSHSRQQDRFVAGGFGISDHRVAYDEDAFRMPYGAAAGAPRGALWAARYLHAVDATEDDLANVVLLTRKHAQLNPRAIWYGRPLTREDYFAAPYVAEPLRIVDCDYPVDNGHAVVLTSRDIAMDLAHPLVVVEATAQATGSNSDWEQWPDLSVSAAQPTGRELWRRTDLTPADVNVAELYEGFSFLLFQWLEGLGFCGFGEGPQLLRDGVGGLQSRLAICTDGGQLGQGRVHGFSKVLTAAEQLRGTTGASQVPGAEVAVAAAGAGPLAGAALLRRD